MRRFFSTHFLPPGLQFPLGNGTARLLRIFYPEEVSLFGKRWQILAFYGRVEARSVVTSVAERFVLRLAATTQTQLGSSPKSKRVPL
jgi:hypothetical protein